MTESTTPQNRGRDVSDVVFWVMLAFLLGGIVGFVLVMSMATNPDPRTSESPPAKESRSASFDINQHDLQLNQIGQ